MQVQVGNLGTSILGLEAGDLITINQTAAGYNWYLGTGAGFGSTEVLGLAGPDAQSLPRPASPAADDVDLLTVLEHELGHVLGLADNTQAGDLMDITLGLGVSRAPTSADLAAIVPVSGAAPPGPAAGSDGAAAVPAEASSPVTMGEAGVVAALLTSELQPPKSSPLAGSGSQAAVDAALESLLSAAGGNSDDKALSTNNGSAAKPAGRLSIDVITRPRKGRANQRALRHPRGALSARLT